MVRKTHYLGKHTLDLIWFDFGYAWVLWVYFYQLRRKQDITKKCQEPKQKEAWQATNMGQRSLNLINSSISMQQPHVTWGESLLIVQFDSKFSNECHSSNPPVN